MDVAVGEAASVGAGPWSTRGGRRDSAVRRIVDVAAVTGAGLVLAPVFVGSAVLVRWRLGAPVLFRQTRTGRSGREFTIVKFRTMHPPRFENEPDQDRLVPLGRALRASSIDELPQLWNVLKGDMSLIGPRPTLPEQVVRYGDRERRRLEIRPGLTGWGQVNGRNSLSWPERIELDIWYIDHRSLRLDLRILARTFFQLLKPSGVTAAGGVNPGFPTAPDPESRSS